jgi:hypothetical protein
MNRMWIVRIRFPDFWPYTATHHVVYSHTVTNRTSHNTHRSHTHTHTQQSVSQHEKMKTLHHFASNLSLKQRAFIADCWYLLYQLCTLQYTFNALARLQSRVACISPLIEFDTTVIISSCLSFPLIESTPRYLSW